ncbi:MAG TPA: glycosyltransferase family 39 protein, partial [Caldilineaceae bacterium]|nr:glycosyltransferase family 39 protein [Caldilineaceae bacterium]
MAALLRFFLIGSKTVWLDEAFSIWLARQPLWDMWSWLIRIDQHPPLYYTLLHGWVSFWGDLQGSVRMLSALCSSLAVPVFYAGVRRLTDRPSALIAALILAISPFHIRFAQEARMYGLLTLAVAVALYCVAVILQERDTPRRVCWGLAISQAAVMLTHNTATVYFPVALNLAVLLIFFNAKRQRRKEADSDETTASIPSDPLEPRHPRSILRSGFGRRWLAFQSVALLLWSPWAWPFVVQTIGVDRQFWIWPPSVGTVWETFHNFNFAFLPGDLPLQAGWMALYTGLVLVGVWHLRRSAAAVWLFLSLLLAPLAIALLVSLRRPIFYDRTLIWLTLPYYALMAAGIRAIGEGLGKKKTETQISQIEKIAQKKSSFQNLRNLRFLRSDAGVWIQTGLLALMLVLSGLSLTGYYFWFEK